MWWGGKKRFLDRHIEEWQLETWRYLLENIGDAKWVAARAPLRSSHPMFAAPPSDDHSSAILLFEQIKEYMGIEDCPAELVKRTEEGGQVDTYLFLQQKGPLGSFEQHGNRLYITYAPKLLRTPLHLAAVLGHELAHYALATIPNPPPGAEDEPLIEELATDLATCFFGLGILHANTAFEFSQRQGYEGQGWSSSFSGYLSEEGRVFSLALHLALRGEREAPDLKAHLQDKLVRAFARIDAEPAILADLRAVRFKHDPAGAAGA
jgi:hypothetical protein